MTTEESHQFMVEYGRYQENGVEYGVYDSQSFCCCDTLFACCLDGGTDNHEYDERIADPQEV
jgi:hypothetical protein